MTGQMAGELPVTDHGIDHEDFLRAVLAGLSKSQKELPCRFFYDERGSALFEQITELEEYYPTRTEAKILDERRAELAAIATPNSVLVEFGSGSSTKTEILLDAIGDLAAYVAIDVSDTALTDARKRIEARFPHLRVETIVADFSTHVEMPRSLGGKPQLGFFPGSTIGNLTRPEARALLRHFREILGQGARFVIGVDLKKDLSILLPAYNDERGVTAAFNLNLLRRINRELGGDFDMNAFRHEAVWNESSGRIEMHLVSLKQQSVHVGGQAFEVADGETIHTENSHKYSVGEFQALAQAAGWRPVAAWTDPQRLFSVHVLESGESQA